MNTEPTLSFHDPQAGTWVPLTEIVKASNQSDRQSEQGKRELTREYLSVTHAHIFWNISSHVRLDKQTKEVMALYILFFNHTRHVFTLLGQYSGLFLCNKPSSDVVYILESTVESTRACCWLEKRMIYRAFGLERAGYIRYSGRLGKKIELRRKDWVRWKQLEWSEKPHKQHSVSPLWNVRSQMCS